MCQKISGKGIVAKQNAACVGKKLTILKLIIYVRRVTS
jgi:hypothetical protein